MKTQNPLEREWSAKNLAAHWLLVSVFFLSAAWTGAGAAIQAWVQRYHGPGNGSDFGNAVAVDGSGNVFVTGSATIKYSGAGVPLWTNQYTSYANAMAVDGSGNVFVTGKSWSGSISEYATIAYSGAGVLLWTNHYNRPGGNTLTSAKAVAVDGSGNVFVTGESWSGSISEYATIAYSGAGVPLWTNRYTGSGSNRNYADAVAADGSGNVFVTGSSLGSGGYNDYVTIAYSGAGVPLWTNRYNGPANEEDTPVGNHPLALGPDGSVYVTGRSKNGVAAPYDIATVKYIYVPRLAMERSAADVIVFWPSAFSDFTLQQNTGGIASMNWSNVTDSIQDNGTTRTLIINPPPTGSSFYRLFKP